MPGPTTEAVNEDVKELKESLHRVEVTLLDKIHAIDNGLTALRAEFGLAKWLIGLTLIATLSGVGAGIWWASGINSRVDGLEKRFDKLDASIAKVLEQTKPKL